MGAVFDLIALAAIAVALSAMLCYAVTHFEGTFSAWGASHYARMSGAANDRKRGHYRT